MDDVHSVLFCDNNTLRSSNDNLRDIHKKKQGIDYNICFVLIYVSLYLAICLIAEIQKGFSISQFSFRERCH